MEPTDATTGFLGLPNTSVEQAHVILLPLPYEGTVSYGHGTSLGPDAILRASEQVELWDEQTGCELDSLRYHTASPIAPGETESPGEYLKRVRWAANELRAMDGLVISIGGEHSVTPPLVQGLRDDPEDLSQVTIIQFDAHADLRDSYEDEPLSHACAMRRVVDLGARVIAIGIRSLDRAESELYRNSDALQVFSALDLQSNAGAHAKLLSTLSSQLSGDIYVSIDIDVLDVHLCPATGTPEPGGLSWYQTLQYLKMAVARNPTTRLIGCDLVETVPMTGSQVNEYCAARLLGKLISYRFW